MRRVGTVVACALALLAPACGRQGSDAQVVISDEERAAELLEASAFRSRAASSVSFQFESAADHLPAGYGGCLSPDPSFAVSGAVDLRSADAWIDVDHDGERDAQRVGDQVYLRAPDAWAAPTPWVTLAVGQNPELSVLRSSGTPIAVAVGGVGFSAEGPGSEDALGNIVEALDEMLEHVQNASTDVTVLGPAEVRGVPTTRYRFSANLLDMIAGSTTASSTPPADERGDADVGAGLESLDDHGLVPDLVVETDVDGDQFVRRSVLAVEYPEADELTPDMPTGVRSTIELWDYDEPVELITIDPASVTAFSNLSASAVVGDQLEQIACVSGSDNDPATREAVEACVRDGIDGKTVGELALRPADPYTCLFELHSGTGFGALNGGP